MSMPPVPYASHPGWLSFTMAFLTLRPGLLVRLKGQSVAVPDFVVVRCEQEMCWLRQHHWPQGTSFAVAATQIAIPPATSATRLANVISMATYRQRRQPF